MPSMDDRRRHELGRERSIRDGGRLLSLVGVLGIFGFVVWATFVSLGSSPPVPATVSALMAIVLAGPQIWAGRAISRLRVKSVVPLKVIAACSLQAYPFGTLVGGWLLFHLRDPALLAVLSSEYRAVVDATPHLDPEHGNGPVVLGVMLALGMLAFGAFSAMVV